jgi:uncharacterized protein (DUF1330 family)
MTVYAVFSYDITDPKRFEQYIPGSAATIFGTIAKHGGEVIFAEGAAEYLNGAKKAMNVCIRFPTAEAVKAWESDPEYAPAKAHRLASTANSSLFIANKFAPPS